MPVIAVAPKDELLNKLRANLSEVSARGGKLYVFADESIKFESDKRCKVVNVPHCPEILDPIIFTIPLQLLSYHVAIMKGTDVDHPRNLAEIGHCGVVLNPTIIQKNNVPCAEPQGGCFVTGFKCKVQFATV